MFAAILGVGVLLRLWMLDLKPFHHDEGVNGFFLIRLFREGYYHYDPENYHGPTLYYVALIFVYLLGLNSLATRLMTAFFGIAMLWLSQDFRATIGRAGALCAIGLLALSPGAVFFSRYFIHEIMFICFTVGLVVTILRYCETRQPTLLLAIGAWTALVFATKETSIITTGVLLIAWPCAWIHVRLHSWLFGNVKSVEPSTAAPLRNGLLDLALWVTSALSVFVLINVILFSSFFTYPDGVRGAVQTFEIWRKTGETAHVHSWDTYFSWLYRTEAHCLVLGAIGVFIALWRAESRRVVFLAYWAIGMFAAYSLIKYKTPWLALNMVLPLAVMGGYACGALISARLRNSWIVGALLVAAIEILGLSLMREPWSDAKYVVPFLVTVGCLASAGLACIVRRSAWWTATPALLLAAGVSLFQTVELNFYRYDDDRYVYVYAHTRRGFNELVDRIQHLAKIAGSGPTTPISVTSSEHWPLSWYLRDFTQVGYHGSITGLDTAVMVVGHANQDGELRGRLRQDFTRVGAYPLRPGVDLILFVRTDIARRAGLTTP
jgi:uncharacterized protein (TIGR03663 family)